MLPLTDLDATALTVYGEARNQPIMGVVAVLAVIANRVATKRWGTSWSSVCQAYEQFSCWNVGDPNAAVLDQYAQAIVQQQSIPSNLIFDTCRYLAGRAIAGDLKDPTGGATHYYAPALVKVTPTWANPPAVRTTLIGQHAFYTHVRF